MILRAKLVLTLTALGLCAAPSAAEEALAGWSENARDLARTITREYGAPDSVAPNRLTWRDRGRWKSIIVLRDAESPDRPDRLVQTIAYEVPLGKWRDISAFDRGATYDAVKDELVARGEDEAMNRLVLNLADEVIRGRRTPAQANAFYDQALALSYAGKTSRYMRKLLFRPRHGSKPRRRLSRYGELLPALSSATTRA